MFQKLGDRLGDIIPFIIALFFSVRFFLQDMGINKPEKPASKFLKIAIYLVTVLLAVKIAFDFLS